MNLWQMQGNTLGPFIDGVATDNKGKSHFSIHQPGLAHRRRERMMKKAA